MAPQRFSFLHAQGEHEVFRKAAEIALNGFVEVLCLHLIELGEVGDGVVQAAAIAEPARDPPHCSELLARRVPLTGTEVVEAGDDLDDLMGRQVLDIVDQRERPPEIPAGDPRQGHDAEECARPGVSAGDLGGYPR